MGRSRPRSGRDNSLPPRQLVVHGRERPRQAEGLHAVHRWCWRLPAEVRRGRGERLRGVRAEHAMMTGDQYLATLDDGRVTYFEGRRVKDLMLEPAFETPARAIAAGYDRFYSP